jgi:hypothetical protein
MKTSRVAGFGCISVVLLLAGCMAYYEWTPAGKTIMTEYHAQKTAEESHAAEWIRDAEDVVDSHYFQPHVSALHVDHRYPLEEAMTDESWASALNLARKVGNKSGVENAYGESSYLHFDRRPLCKVVPQPHRSAVEPVTCVVQSGEHSGKTVYATSIGD